MRVHRKSAGSSAKRKFHSQNQSDFGGAIKKSRIDMDDEDTEFTISEGKQSTKIEQPYTEADDSNDNILVGDKDDDDDDDDDDDNDDGQDDNDHNGLSSYEMERLANIEKNQLFFKELNMKEVKDSFQQVTGKQPKAIKPGKYGLKREKKEKEHLPRRSSLRLQRMDPMGVPLPEIPKDDQQTVSEQFRRVYYYTKTVNRIGLHGVEVGKYDVDRRGRKTEEVIEMRSYNGIENDICRSVVQEWCGHSNKHQKNIGVKSEEPLSDLESYKKTIEKFSIADDHAAKVVPDRIFSIIVHPMVSKILVFAGDKWGKIGVRDLYSKEGHDGVFLFEPHTKPINVLSFDPFCSSKIFSCSYDGTVRCGDMEKQQFTQVFATPEDDDILINGFAWRAKSNHTIMIAKNDYTAGLVDIRSGKEENNVVAHGKSVRWIDCHPFDENFFLTTCQDGSVATWDIRKLKNIKSKLSEIKCNRVVSSAFYSPLTGSKILVTSLDDTVRVYDVNASGSISNPPRCMIRHNNQTGRWLTKFRATWDPKTDNCFVIGSMSRPRAIDFYNTEGKGSLIKQISHENFSSITSLNVFHPTLNIIAGGNSSGKVFVWK